MSDNEPPNNILSFVLPKAKAAAPSKKPIIARNGLKFEFLTNEPAHLLEQKDGLVTLINYWDSPIDFPNAHIGPACDPPTSRFAQKGIYVLVHS